MDDKFIETIAHYTMLRCRALRSLDQLCRHLRRQAIDGDIVQCGVWKGGSATVMAHATKANRHLWLYDSFEQTLPTPTPKDRRKPKRFVDKLKASPDDVYEVMSLVGISRSRYTIRQGWFEDTFKMELPNQVALLHCDCDWYESVILTLETFYPLMPKGGIIVLDDYNAWVGCREAFFDFCFKYNIRPRLMALAGSPRTLSRRSPVYWIKDN